MNPDTIGCLWTGEFDLNTLRVDGDFFESGKKNLRIQKYPDTCGRGLILIEVWGSASQKYLDQIENFRKSSLPIWIYHQG